MVEIARELVARQAPARSLREVHENFCAVFSFWNMMISYNLLYEVSPHSRRYIGQDHRRDERRRDPEVTDAISKRFNIMDEIQ